jgi:hypothetical protein
MPIRVYKIADIIDRAIGRWCFRVFVAFGRAISPPFSRVYSRRMIQTKKPRGNWTS